MLRRILAIKSRIIVALDKRFYKLLLKMSNYIFTLSKKTKISTVLLVAEFSSFGGTRTYFKFLLKFYNQHNIRVKVLVDNHYVDEDIIKYITDLGFTYSYLAAVPSYIKRNNHLRINNLLEHIVPILKTVLIDRPDMLVFSVGTPGYLVGNIFFPIRFLYILHTYPSQSGLKNIYVKLLQYYLSQYKCILTVSNYAKNDILKVWKLRHKEYTIKVIHNTIDKCLFKSSQEKDNDSVRILTLGHVETYKNPELWIEIAKKVIDLNNENSIKIEFIWAGDGRLLDACRKKVQELSLENVYFIGFRQDVNTLYKHANIYFQPSLIESFGLSVLEAMAHSLPCIVTNVGGLPELVLDGETGFITEASDKDMIVDRINFLINNRFLSKEMGASGLKRFRDKFNYSQWQKQMLELHK